MDGTFLNPNATHVDPFSSMSYTSVEIPDEQSVGGTVGN